MKKNIEIQTVMTLCPHSVGVDQDIVLAREMMAEHSIHHLPVQRGGRLVGVVSDRDLKFATGWTKAKKGELLVQDVYTPEPYIVAPTTRVEEVLRKMVADQIGCTLIAIHQDKLVGIFTTTDACRYLADLLAACKD